MRTNLSQFIRDLELETKGPNSVYRRAGQELRDIIWNEFETLLDETAQYSGSTVASWRLGWMYSTPEEFVELPRPATMQDALQKGADGPIALARIANIGFKIDPMSLVELTRQDIVITNGSPHFEQAEYGPLRSVNAPAGALERFAQRLGDKFETLGD